MFEMPVPLEKTYHLPVMLEESVDFLLLNPAGIYVDCTAGSGGHAELILKRLSPEGKLIAIDQDEAAISLVKERLKSYAEKIFLFNENFVNLEGILKRINFRMVDGLLFDLGVSNLQMSSPERGFSFRSTGPLDMRMDQRGKIDAAKLLNTLSEEELTAIFKSYGEERWAKRIARAVVKTRIQRPLSTVPELVNVVFRALPEAFHRQRIHPATRIFQALRIAVNRELENLREGLITAKKVLKGGGRIVVISYHSLEDRIVKHFFQQENFTILTPHPLRPTKEEIKINRRARSARLRAAEKKYCSE